MTKKKPALAFLLSFIVPGAGLWYLNKWRMGFINLLTITAIGTLIGMMAPGIFYEYIHYIVVAFAAGSGGFAHTVALQVNRESATESQATHVGDEVTS